MKWERNRQTERYKLRELERYREIQRDTEREREREILGVGGMQIDREKQSER